MRLRGREEGGELKIIRDNFRHAKRKQIIRRQITQRPRRTKCEMHPHLRGNAYSEKPRRRSGFFGSRIYLLVWGQSPWDSPHHHILVTRAMDGKIYLSQHIFKHCLLIWNLNMICVQPIFLYKILVNVFLPTLAFLVLHFPRSQNESHFVSCHQGDGKFSFNFPAPPAPVVKRLWK